LADERSDNPSIRQSVNPMIYVYGIVPAKAAASGVPDGIDDASVSIVKEGRLAALVSDLGGEGYDPDSISASSGDMGWVAPRAKSHDLVLTWASDRGPVIPLPMFTSTFASLDSVRAMLRERAAELMPVLEKVARGREYALRVYRVDAELRAALPKLNEEIGKLKAAADAATPGQRYLLERKLEERAKEELRATSSAVAGEIRDALARVALETTTSPIPRVTTDAPGTMILNAAFLIAPEGLRAFQERLTAIVNERQPSGFRFDFTGPWPAYHFALGETR
jgi:hypothetical protein